MRTHQFHPGQQVMWQVEYSLPVPAIIWDYDRPDDGKDEPYYYVTVGEGGEPFPLPEHALKAIEDNDDEAKIARVVQVIEREVGYNLDDWQLGIIEEVFHNELLCK